MKEGRKERRREDERRKIKEVRRRKEDEGRKMKEDKEGRRNGDLRKMEEGR